MRNRTLAQWGMGAALLLTGFARAESASPPATRPAATTQSLLAELTSDDWRVRQGAINELVKRGATARPDVERALSAAGTDPSAQADLRSVLHQIDEDARFGPTRVTMHLDPGTKAKEAFEELARQTGIKFMPVPPNAWDLKRAGGDCAGDWDGAPFWQVLADLCARTGSVPNPGMMAGGNPDTLPLYMGSNGMFEGPTCFSGPCAIIATSVQRNQSVTFGRAPAAGNGTRRAELRMQAYVWVEPKVRVLSMTGVGITEATDDLGNSLTEPRRPGGGPGGGGWPNGRGIFNLSLPLRDVDGIGKTLATLKGVVRMQVVASAETVEASTAGEGVGGSGRRLSDGVRVRVTELREDGNLCTVKIHCAAEDRRQRLDIFAQTAQTGSLRMVDAEGRGLMVNGINQSQNNGTVDLTGQFPMQVIVPGRPPAKATPPIRLVWDVPVGLREVRVPFEFHGLPLP